MNTNSEIISLPGLPAIDYALNLEQRQDSVQSASDKAGHYDMDGVSYACGQVIVASDARSINCQDSRFRHFFQ